MLSGVLVVISVIPYALRTYQGKTKPNITSWTLWTLIGAALLFAITDHTFPNYILPLYMFLGTFIISVPLVRDQLRHKIPLREWT